MLRIHHLVSSRSDRIVWLVEELGIQYEIVRHLRDPLTFRSPDSLRQVTPLAKAPVIQDGELTIAESAVICDYILERYGCGRLRPSADSPDRLRYAYWMHCAESSLMYPVLIDVLAGMTQTDAPALMAFVMGEYQTMFGYIEQVLTEHDYIVGNDFTAADVMVYYTLSLGAGVAIAGATTHAPMAAHPRVQAYLKRLEHRPAWQKAKAICAACST